MEINRRTFLKGVAGMSIAAVAGTTFWIKNKSPEEVEKLIENAVESDAEILVIGGGMAGVMAAIRAARAGANVTLVDKGSVGRSGLTPFANGFKVYDEEEGADRETWIEEWKAMTGGMDHSGYLENLMDNSKEIYEELESWGATEVGFGKVLRLKVQEEGIEIIERTMLTNLLEKDGKVAGALGFKLDSEEAVVIKANAVVLCTGGGAFKPNGFQVSSLTSDGDAMAYRIGGQISGKEFMDTHFTYADNPAYCWGQWSGLWSTGMMKETQTPDSEGNNLNLDAYHTAHAGELPITKSGGPPADEETLEGESDGERPGGPPDGDMPEGMEAPEGMEGGPGESGGSAPEEIGGASAGLGVHKSEGLFPTDEKCGTNIEGLFAAGDCLSSMLTGPSYGGAIGTALAASATQGALAGGTAYEYAISTDIPEISDEEITTLQTEMFAPRELDQGYDPAWVTQMLKFNTIPYYVLYIKKEDRLQAALNNVLFFKEHYADKMVAGDAHELRLVHETRNMILNAEMKLRASLYRTESRGNHYREDFPDTNDTDWLAWVVIEQGANGEMELSKVMV
jgi:succinate dehydrogenase/fumarate reductase flavoprotein subunit